MFLNIKPLTEMKQQHEPERMVSVVHPETGEVLPAPRTTAERLVREGWKRNEEQKVVSTTINKEKD